LPTKEEIINCSYYLRREIDTLKEVKVYIILGRIAFDNFKRITGLRGEFQHGKILSFNGKYAICSYILAHKTQTQVDLNGKIG